MSIKKIVYIILTSAMAVSPIAFMADAQAETLLAQNNSSQTSAGFKVPDEYLQSVNQLQITELVYTGECPGKKLKSDEVVFFSNNTPAAEDRRVIIRNITGSEGNEVNLDLQPYTDREYQDEEGSEDIKITLGSKHDDGKLVVFEGENQFKYEIVDVEEQGDQEIETIIEEGNFSASAEKVTEYEDRYARELYSPKDAEDYGDKDGDGIPNYKSCPF